jgi:glycosyltransferase involved in cell wall biosynthesis
MRCPTLSNLPQPPPGKIGWPWTEECPQLPDLRPDGTPWPRISIVTPSYNQGQYIEETIRSILLQGYPDLEYIIMDGGSKDATTVILNKYSKFLKYWESSSDEGQADAINKGISHATGEVFNFINSDDLVARNGLALVGTLFEPNVVLATGIEKFSECGKSIIIFNENIHLKSLLGLESEKPAIWHGLGIWFPLKEIHQTGKFDASLHYFFDYDILIRRILMLGNDINHVNIVTTCFRDNQDSKSANHPIKFREEHVKIIQKIIINRLLRDQNKYLQSEIARMKREIFDMKKGQLIFIFKNHIKKIMIKFRILDI